MDQSSQLFCSQRDRQVVGRELGAVSYYITSSPDIPLLQKLRKPCGEPDEHPPAKSIDITEAREREIKVRLLS